MFFKILLSSVLFLVMQTAVAVNIVVTIPPLASMVNPLLTKSDKVTILLTAGKTPCGFKLKPSHMLDLEKADIILTLGTKADRWAVKALERWPEKVITMVELPGLVKLTMRRQSESGWRIPVMTDQQIVAQKTATQKIAKTYQHLPQGNLHLDPHIWLSPYNASLLIKAFKAKYLQTIDNQSATDEFKLLATKYLANLAKVDLSIKEQLQPVSNQAFVVLHDAFQYFEAHYQLHGVGAIQVSPALPPSIKRVLQMQEIIRERQVVCVFKKPQFPADQVNYLVRGLDVDIGIADPLGGFSKNERYDVFLQTLADQFKSCLKL